MESITQNKCVCAHCGHILEYAPGLAGRMVECPHCKKQSRLPEPESEGAAQVAGLRPLAPSRLCPSCGQNMAPYDSTCEGCASRRGRIRKLLFALLCAALLPCVGWMFLSKYYSTTQRAPRPSSTMTPRGPVPSVKSAADFKISPFRLELRGANRQVIAAGEIQNVSTNLYHHLSASVDLLDAHGAKIGAVTADAPGLAPHQTWKFLAAVIEPRAKSLRFASVKEIQ